MYQLNFAGFQIYDPRIPELTIRDVSVHLAVDEAGSMSFTVDQDHPFAGQLTRLKGRLELLSDGPAPSSGAVSSRTPRTLTSPAPSRPRASWPCLNDSIVPPFDFPADYEDDPGYAGTKQCSGLLAGQTAGRP